MSAFGHALGAELRHLARDRWDLAGLTLIPALLLFLIGAMFWQGSMRRLRVTYPVAWNAPSSDSSR